MKLQKALASTAVCHCHKVNLRLDSGPWDPTRFNFRFVLTEDSVTSASSQSTIQSQSTCLLIESGPGAIVEGSSAVNSCKSSQVVVLEKQAVTHKNTEKRARRRVQFDMGSSSMDLRDSSTTGCVARGTLPIAAPAPQSVLEAIDDLCNFLKRTDLTNERSTCLGYVKSDDSYNHIVYRDLPETLAPASRISLYSILSSLNMPEKQKLLPRGDRLKLGLALSLSVLHFGSYTDSWFKEHWRSQDIYFFGDRQQHELSSISSPHVATSLGYILEGESSVESEQQAGTILARNMQLFSLAIVLIEIAYGDLLCSIFENGGRTEGPRKLDEFAEYLKAKMVSGFIGREMGKKYADVVKRCLYCDFGVDESDLGNRKLQEMYFTHVVCKLEQCVRQFSN